MGSGGTRGRARLSSASAPFLWSFIHRRGGKGISAGFFFKERGTARLGETTTWSRSTKDGCLNFASQSLLVSLSVAFALFYKRHSVRGQGTAVRKKKKRTDLQKHGGVSQLKSGGLSALRCELSPSARTHFPLPFPLCCEPWLSKPGRLTGVQDLINIHRHFTTGFTRAVGPRGTAAAQQHPAPARPITSHKESTRPTSPLVGNPKTAPCSPAAVAGLKARGTPLRQQNFANTSGGCSRRGVLQRCETPA